MDTVNHPIQYIVDFALNQGEFSDQSNQNKQENMNPILDTSVIFYGHDVLLGNIIIILYKTASDTRNLSSIVISRAGCDSFKSLNISSNSKYRPGILSLPLEMRKSKVRRSLAVSILKSFAKLSQNSITTLKIQAGIKHTQLDWDEINAGQLAAIMKPLDESKLIPVLGQINNFGYLSNETFDSFVVDTIYQDLPKLNDSNNTLAFLLGNQIEQLFDPLTEYSPEPTERAYKPPQNYKTKMINTPLMDQICQELINVQTNFTSLMVSVLQQFIVPLRIVVLKGQIPNYSTNKLNQILPPTIDEVTRINCIFLDMLKLAQPYGSYEILKACGTSIPYFYKALMRNQAATKNFRDNFLKLVNDLKACGREDLLGIDKGKINDIVYSSLHLTKLRLIIHRLYKSNIWDSKIQSNVDQFIQSCDDTISSFANDTLKPYNGRVFTPTGKILAEIANGWPMELQYGWLTRRVVAIFDGTDLLCDDVQNRGVIVVFSDHILFLSIVDDQYYSDYWQSSTNLTHKPSVSDVLMHSLTNETPFTNLPNMKVKNWAKVNDLDASYFDNSTVKFYDSKSKDFLNIYKLDDQVLSCRVSEIIARSKVLNKSQSFHLFLNNSTIDRNLYFVTHSSESYSQEETKSPILLLFNTVFNANSLLVEYPNAHCILTLNFVNESTIKIQGVSISHLDELINFEIPVNDLERILSRLVLQLTSHINEISNPSKTEYISSINDLINNFIIQHINRNETNLMNEKFKIISRSKITKTETDIVSEQAIEKVRSLDLLNDSSHLGRSGTTKVNKNHVKRKSSILNFFTRPKNSNTPQQLDSFQENSFKDEADGSIYVNSKFEFPMDEPSNESYEYLKGVKYAKLNDKDGNCKGYKDSVDMMTKMDKVENAKTNEFYDDMFEFSEKHESAVNKSMIPTSPNKLGMTFNNGSKLNIPKQNVSSPIKKKLSPISTKPSIPRNSMLYRSDSYYVKFQQMISKQEELIKKNGISDISNLSSLSNLASPNGSMTTKLLTRKFSQLKVAKEEDGVNWVKFGSNSHLHSTISAYSEIHKPLVKKEKIETIEESTIQEPEPLELEEVVVHKQKPPQFQSSTRSSSVKLLSSTIIKSFTPEPEFESLAEEDKYENSFGSSIYESSIMADFGKFNSVRSAKDYDNPYVEFVKMEPVAETIKMETVPEVENDKGEVSDVENYAVEYADYTNFVDDSTGIDFFGDLNLDLSKQEAQPELTNLSSETINEIAITPKTPGNKITFDDIELIEPQVLPSETTSMSLCSVLNDTTEAEMLLKVWNSSDNNSFLIKSDTVLGLQSLLNDKSYAYLNAVFDDRHLERGNLVRDPTHWNLAKNISH